jgi:hypothetical protein
LHFVRGFSHRNANDPALHSRATILLILIFQELLIPPWALILSLRAGDQLRAMNNFNEILRFPVRLGNCYRAPSPPRNPLCPGTGQLRALRRVVVAQSPVESIFSFIPGGRGVAWHGFRSAPFQRLPAVPIWSRAVRGQGL